MASDLMVKTIEEAGMEDRSTIQSFVLEALSQIKRLNRRLKTSALFEPGAVQWLSLKTGLSADRNKILQKALAVDADIVSPHFLYINPDFIRECQALGKKVLPWVINEEKMMETYLDWGVDGMISDYPDRLQRAYSNWMGR